MSDHQHMTKYPPHHLTRVERLAISIGQRIHRPGFIRNVSAWWGKVFTCRILKMICGHRWVHHHTEKLDSVSGSNAVLVVSNHRTFFDMYVGITALRYLSDYRLGYPAVFPVRAPFFYDRLIGIVVNLIASGGCMWPPVFRDERRSVLNPVTTELMKNLLTQDGVCFGFHPEGKRSKSDDPYTLEPPKRGIGQLVENAPEGLVIIPLFISGLSGDVKKEWRLRHKEATHTHPIRFYWGSPKTPNDFKGTTEEVAQHIHAEIQKLADEARQAEAK